MKSKIALATVTALVLLTGCASAPHTTGWEYRWITPTRQDFQQAINIAANEGWEVVSAGPDANAGDNMSAILRRPKR